LDAKETSWTLGAIAAELGGQLFGPEGHPVSRPVPADSDDPHGIAFAGSRKYLAAAVSSAVGSLLVSEDLLPVSKPHVVVPDPRRAFGRLLHLWKQPLPLFEGVHPTAIVDPSAQVDPGAWIGPYAVVERGARVCAGCRVYPFVYIGEGCSLGEGCVIYPHAVLYQDVFLGNRTIVHSGAVLGADGFGFEWDGERQARVPQIGRVEVGEDGEIGANTCVDRATAGSTELEKGVKLDNLVQIGHNSRIGEHSVIAAQTGLSGSTQVGKRVTMGGAVATSHHVRIADDVLLGGRTGVTSDIEEAGEYWGMPPRPMREAMRASLLIGRLPELANRIRELERRLGELESE
jgi:UDP-3-O-[3-hydroxymyristoyl] glucosamine N-acyltransferase